MLISSPIILRNNNHYVILNDQRYFLFQLNGKTYLIKNACPHRGGPLSLGKWCELKKGIECPWHGNVIKAPTLIKRSLSAVRILEMIFIPME